MKKIIAKTVGILISIVIALSPLFLTESVSAAGLYEYCSESFYHHMNSFGHDPQDYGAQSFRPESTHILTGVSLYMTRYDVPTNTTFFRLETNYAGNNTPSGTILGTGSMSNTVLTDSNAWCPTVSISGSNVVTANETYWIVWWTDDRVELLKVPKQASSDPNADSYTRGLVGTWHTGDGGYWTSGANGDALFKEYGTEAVPPPSPPTVTTVGATAETYVGATLTGNLTSLGDAETVRTEFFYGLTAPTYGYYEVANFDQNSTGEFSKVITDMPANTTVHYQARATGRVGGVDVSFANGTDMTFNTPAVPITPTPTPTGTPPTVSTGEVAYVNNSTVCLYGTLDSTGTASNVTVGFDFGTGIPTEYYFNSTQSPMNTTGDFLLYLTGLATNTTWTYRAYATGDGSAAGIYKTFTTSSTPLTNSVVQILPATNITDTTATLNGQLFPPVRLSPRQRVRLPYTPPRRIFPARILWMLARQEIISTTLPAYYLGRFIPTGSESMMLSLLTRTMP